MLQINLLPIRQLKKRAKAKKQFSLMIFLLLLVLGLIGAAGFIQAQKISALQGELAALKKEKDSYSPTLKKIEKLKKDRLELDRKTGIIKQLKTDSSLTVRILDEVANRVDNQRMWLSSLQQKNTSLTLKGIALDNQTIAQFMDNLKASPFVRDVSLVNSSLKIVSGKSLKSFSLNCAVASPTSETDETVKPKTN